MPLGASSTVGARSPETGGYRGYLERMLTDDGVDVRLRRLAAAGARVDARPRPRGPRRHDHPGDPPVDPRLDRRHAPRRRAAARRHERPDPRRERGRGRRPAAEAPHRYLERRGRPSRPVRRRRRCVGPDDREAAGEGGVHHRALRHSSPRCARRAGRSRSTTRRAAGHGATSPTGCIPTRRVTTWWPGCSTARSSATSRCGTSAVVPGPDVSKATFRTESVLKVALLTHPRRQP